VHGDRDGIRVRPLRTDAHAEPLRPLTFGELPPTTPDDSLCGSFDTILGGFKTIAARWSRSDQRRLFYENARAVYRTGESERATLRRERGVSPTGNFVPVGTRPDTASP